MFNSIFNSINAEVEGCTVTVRAVSDKDKQDDENLNAVEVLVRCRDDRNLIVYFPRECGMDVLRNLRMIVAYVIHGTLYIVDLLADDTTKKRAFEMRYFNKERCFLKEQK